MIKTFSRVLLVFIFAIPLYGHAQQASSLQEQFRVFAADASLKNASWSLDVVEAHTGKPILSHNSQLSLVPASTQKVVTTATALLLLGSDFRYPTRVIIRGNIHQGVLHGDLIIKGSGDPTLGAVQMDDSLSLERVFNYWLNDIRAAGIGQITGSIIADDSVFDREMVPRKWIWEDIGNYYGAGSSGLTVHENMYTVFFQAGGKPGDAVKVLGTDPVIPGMVLENQVSTGPAGSGDQVYIFGAPFSNQRILTGTIPAGSSRFPVRGSIPDPPAYLAFAFNEFLNQNNIPTSVKSPTAGNSSIKEQTISTWWSPSLKDIAYRTNLNSNNTYAENLLKTLGYQISGQGNLAAGNKALLTLWSQLGVDMDGMRLHDGSGLSPSNRLTTRQITSILSYCAQHAVFEDLRQGFPLAGVSGSLANAFHDTASRGVLAAKSGFLSNVRSFAGYTTTRDGTLVAFAFIVNDYQGSPAAMRLKMVQLMNAITLHNHSKP